MSKRWRELQASLERVGQHLDQLDRRAERMETILMVREPSAPVAADAYEGLRKQVVTAVTARFTYLAQLVQLDAALAHGADRDYIARTVSGWLEQASLARVTDTSRSDQDLLFEFVEDLGGPVEVLEPAYVDTVPGRVIRPGQARRAPPPATPEPPAAARRDAEQRAAAAAPAREDGQ